MFHTLLNFTDLKFTEPHFIFIVPHIHTSELPSANTSSVVTVQLYERLYVPRASYTSFTLYAWFTWSGKSLPSTSSLLD